jgi:hypothetical protein
MFGFTGARIVGKYRRGVAKRFARRSVAVDLPAPIISFTFDDAPQTAFATGGEILKGHGAKATFYLSLGLLVEAAKEGHELGCHTFDHLDAWHTPGKIFCESILENKRALSCILPEIDFQTFAYPKSGPTLWAKRALTELFVCCRGGGQTANVGTADLNLVKACFIDRRTNIDRSFVRGLIDHNASQRGWLVFATHDVSSNPSPYGCTPEFLEYVVAYAARSGARLLPMAEACAVLVGSAEPGTPDGPVR